MYNDNSSLWPNGPDRTYQSVYGSSEGGGGGGGGGGGLLLPLWLNLEVIIILVGLMVCSLTLREFCGEE